MIYLKFNYNKDIDLILFINNIRNIYLIFKIIIL